MDKSLDFEKLVEQARFLSQLMNSGAFATGEAEANGPSDDSPEAGGGYAGAFSAADGDIPIPDIAENQDIIEKAVQAVKLFQAMNDSGLTSDRDAAYDNTSVHNDFTEDTPHMEGRFDDNAKQRENTGADFSRLYDETFSTPDIKALKAAVRFLDPRYHKALGIWIKFLEMQNMLNIYAKRAEEGAAGPGYGDWRRGLLMSVRPYVSLEKQYAIDFLIKVIELKEIISVMEEVRDGG